ncbi:hypothetical protein [Kordia sp.]|uniref:hypothetical protein n=1 Tax=Kordia sp. TaxID=1965332 RepID=UPI0025B98CA9|nr:hypothetical protein [Kordia sp.]MCH2194916.1 hypothetical protein [Kordia sp.]
MKPQQLIFEKIEQFLKEGFEELLVFYDNGKHISVEETGLWIAVDESELTIGFEENYRQFNPEWEDISNAVTMFINILTKQKRITQYRKGSFIFKTKLEVEDENENFKYTSTSMTWLFPYWRKTTQKISFIEPIIQYKKVAKELEILQESIKKIQ